MWPLASVALMYISRPGTLSSPTAGTSSISAKSMRIWALLPSLVRSTEPPAVGVYWSVTPLKPLPSPVISIVPTSPPCENVPTGVVDVMGSGSGMTVRVNGPAVSAELPNVSMLTGRPTSDSALVVRTSSAIPATASGSSSRIARTTRGRGPRARGRTPANADATTAPTASAAATRRCPSREAARPIITTLPVSRADGRAPGARRRQSVTEYRPRAPAVGRTSTQRTQPPVWRPLRGSVAPTIPRFPAQPPWAVLGSNQRPPACKAGALTS